MTGLGVPGVNQHEPDVREQLRVAITRFNATVVRGLAHTPEAHNLAHAAAELLAELDNRAGDEP